MLAKIGSKAVALATWIWSGDSSGGDLASADGGIKRLGGAVSRVFKTRERRRAMRRVASVYFDDVRCRGVVCDMSPGGAMIEMRMPPADGEKLRIVIRGMAPLTGEVRWRRENKVGVQFETPILHAEVMECLFYSEDNRS